VLIIILSSNSRAIIRIFILSAKMQPPLFAQKFARTFFTIIVVPFANVDSDSG